MTDPIGNRSSDSLFNFSLGLRADKTGIKNFEAKPSVPGLGNLQVNSTSPTFFTSPSKLYFEHNSGLKLGGAKHDSSSHWKASPYIGYQGKNWEVGMHGNGREVRATELHAQKYFKKERVLGKLGMDISSHPQFAMGATKACTDSQLGGSVRISQDLYDAKLMGSKNFLDQNMIANATLYGTVEENAWRCGAAGNIRKAFDRPRDLAVQVDGQYEYDSQRGYGGQIGMEVDVRAFTLNRGKNKVNVRTGIRADTDQGVTPTLSMDLELSLSSAKNRKQSRANSSMQKQTAPKDPLAEEDYRDNCDSQTDLREEIGEKGDCNVGEMGSENDGTRVRTSADEEATPTLSVGPHSSDFSGFTCSIF